MASIFASLVPVFLVILTGWVARATRFVEEEHWLGLERVTYVIFFPAVIIDTLSRADLGSVPVASVGGALIGAILSVAFLLLAARAPLQRALSIDGPSFTSLFQGSTRWNTFVALAVAGSLYGTRGLALMAVAVAAMVPLLNILALYVFFRFGKGVRQSGTQILITFVTNPFIWSCAIGLALNPFAAHLPRVFLSYADVLGRASLAAGLLVVGAGLDIRRLAKPGPIHLLSTVLKLVVLPIVAALLARFLNVSGPDMAVVVLAASVPTASAAYVLARQLGGNAPLMAEILTLQTIVALVSMPLMIVFLSG